MASSNEINRFLDELGHPGKYAWLIFFFLCLNYFPVTFNHLVMSIYGAVPPHRCRLPDGVIADNTSIPEDEGKLDSCQVYVNYTSSSEETQACPDGWEYTLNGGESTIVNEWNLVCDDKYITSLATSMYFAGVMVGGLACGPIADITGRRTLMLITMYLPILLGIMVYLVESIPLFMLLRFIIGFMMQGVQICTYVLCSELCTTAKNRAYATAFFESCWALGVMTLSGIAYIFKDWRYIQLGISVPAILSLAWVWLLPESLRFLIGKSRFEESLANMQKAARFNKVTISAQTEKDLFDFCSKDHSTKDDKKSVWVSFKTPNLRKHTLVMWYIWFATSLAYYGLSLQASRFTGDKYLNFFISGAIELPAYLSGIWILSIIGRRIPLVTYFLVGGVACILAGTIPKETGSGDDIAWVSTMLAWIGKFGMAGAFSVLFLYSSELYPTVFRNAAVGSCTFWARVGGLVAPQINLIGLYYQNWIPIVIFGIVAIIGGLVTLILPETKYLQLADTIEEAEALGKKSNRKNPKELDSNGTYAGENKNLGYEDDAGQTRL